MLQQPLPWEWTAWRRQKHWKGMSLKRSLLTCSVSVLSQQRKLPIFFNNTNLFDIFEIGWKKHREENVIKRSAPRFSRFSSQTSSVFLVSTHFLPISLIPLWFTRDQAYFITRPFLFPCCYYSSRSWPQKDFQKQHDCVKCVWRWWCHKKLRVKFARGNH